MLLGGSTKGESTTLAGAVPARGYDTASVMALCSGAMKYLIVLAATPLFALTSTTSPVPEPSTMLLVGGGLAAAILYTRKRLGQK